MNALCWNLPTPLCYGSRASLYYYSPSRTLFLASYLQVYAVSRKPDDIEPSFRFTCTL